MCARSHDLNSAIPAVSRQVTLPTRVHRRSGRHAEKPGIVRIKRQSGRAGAWGAVGRPPVPQEC